MQSIFGESAGSTNALEITCGLATEDRGLRVLDDNRYSIQKKGCSYILRGIDGSKGDIKIPSQMFPLPKGDIGVIYNKNSEDFPDNARTDIIREVFDSIVPETGCCYTNAQRLVDALHEAGIMEATPWVGWVTIAGTMPVHHCFVVVDTHVLDFFERMDVLCGNTDTRAFLGMTKEGAREMLAKNVAAAQKTPNSEKGTFGKADENMLYIGAPCLPYKGAEQFRKMMRTFPNHPSYTNIDAYGSNKTQDAIRSAKGELPASVLPSAQRACLSGNGDVSPTKTT